MGYYGNGWGGAGWGMLFGGPFWILLIVLLVVGVLWFSRSSRDAPQRDRRLSGLDVLDERYARGELDREEYLQKRQDILGRNT